MKCWCHSTCKSFLLQFQLNIIIVSKCWHIHGYTSTMSVGGVYLASWSCLLWYRCRNLIADSLCGVLVPYATLLHVFLFRVRVCIHRSWLYTCATAIACGGKDAREKVGAIIIVDGFLAVVVGYHEVWRDVVLVFVSFGRSITYFSNIDLSVQTVEWTMVSRLTASVKQNAMLLQKTWTPCFWSLLIVYLAEAD